MLKVKWDIEEAVALYSLYIQCKIPIPKDRLKKLSLVLNNRANILGITVDEKFRNTAGLAMQASCIEYVVTNGEKGLSNSNKLFYQTHKLFTEQPEKFNASLNEFIKKYGEF